MKRLIFALAMVAVVGLAVVPGYGQMLVPENHYLVYNVIDPLNHIAELQLRDQWGSWEGHQDLILEKFANPLYEKNGEHVMFDPLVHHTWWRLLAPIPTAPRSFLVEHQFGLRELVAGEAIYLINPADKDQQIPPPDEWPRWANHYLCYQILQGDPLIIPLFTIDQWGPHQDLALEPYCFCNPVEKTDLTTGEQYPIQDQYSHLTCYLLEFNPFTATFFYEDQFAANSNGTFDKCLICLPSLKHDAVPTEDTNWGRIKALFGDE